MNKKMWNPYYDANKLGLEIISIEQGYGYEYDTLCFWKTKNGRIYTASDSGCSCPKPFEKYEGENLNEILQKLDVVKDLQHALEIILNFKGKENYSTTDEELKLIKWGLK